MDPKSSRAMEKDLVTMIDIHTHILAGVDDGAASLDEAYEMALAAVRSGTKALIATPHSNKEPFFSGMEVRDQNRAFSMLKEILIQENIPLKLYQGMEIWSSSDIVEKLKVGTLLTLNQSAYVLLEFAYDEELWWIEAILTELQEAGYIPVVAHPERYFCVMEEPNRVYEWRTRGILTQMNKGSILGRFGSEVERTAELLLRHHLFTCIASDAHHSHVRTTDMKELYRYLQKYYSSMEQEKLLHQNPSAILYGIKIKSDRDALRIRG